MGPTHRLDVKDLDIVPVDAQTCRALVQQSGAHLRSAQMLREVDAEGAFQLAYDGCRKVALAVVSAVGTRPRGPAHHAVTFDAAAAVVVRDGGARAAALKRALDDATDLRRVRGAAEYRGESVAAADVTDAIDVLTELLDGLPGLVESRLT